MTDTTKTTSKTSKATSKTSKAKAAATAVTTDAAGAEQATQVEAKQEVASLALITVYEGTKRLKAQPLTRGEYNTYRGWELPANEKAEDEGYLTEDPEGSSNHPAHSGYVQWLPKAEFERIYKAIPGADKPAHQQRVIQESTELGDRTQKLEHFIHHNQVFGTLPMAEQDRMRKQFALMRQLHAVLEERIAAF